MRLGPGGWRLEPGQAFVEYTMMLGLLTAIIIALTLKLVPAVGWTISRLVEWIAVHVSSSTV